MSVFWGIIQINVLADVRKCDYVRSVGGYVVPLSLFVRGQGELLFVIWESQKKVLALHRCVRLGLLYFVPGMYVAMLAGVKVARLGHRSDRSRSRSSSSSPRLPL